MTTTDTNRVFTRQETAINDILLSLADVEKISGFKKSKLYQLMKEGLFPKPIRLGKRSNRWKRSSMNNWINELPTQE
jgi:predicted DNA-binding transcriptional regulator AlpA